MRSHSASAAMLIAPAIALAILGALGCCSTPGPAPEEIDSTWLAWRDLLVRVHADGPPPPPVRAYLEDPAAHPRPVVFGADSRPIVADAAYLYIESRSPATRSGFFDLSYPPSLELGLPELLAGDCLYAEHLDPGRIRVAFMCRDSIPAGQLLRLQVPAGEIDFEQLRWNAIELDTRAVRIDPGGTP